MAKASELWIPAVHSDKRARTHRRFIESGQTAIEIVGYD